MSVGTQRPVLLVGGSGVVGSRAARALRRLHPDLPLAIGGRDLGKARAVADEVGGASAARVDLARGDLGLGDASFGAVVVLLKDDSLRAMKYAQAKGLPYVSFSTWAFDVAPEVAHYVHRPASAPVLMLGHVLGGTGTLSTLYFARGFRSIESIALGVVVDSDDGGGPAASEDMARVAKSVPRPLILKDGFWVWAGEGDAARTFRGADGVERPGQAMPLLDVVSLAAATGARSVRVDFAVRDAAGRPAGAGVSHEIAIEIEGERRDGGAGLFRYEFVDGRGLSDTSAFGVALAVERLLGLAGGAPVGPGLYHPESLIDPEYAVARLREFGTRVRAA
jgi:hypothetical protein